MANHTLWLPDGMSCRVEWYLSDGRAAGVESVSDDWVPHQVGRRRPVGYGNDRLEPYDPDRDEWEARGPRRSGRR